MWILVRLIEVLRLIDVLRLIEVLRLKNLPQLEIPWSLLFVVQLAAQYVIQFANRSANQFEMLPQMVYTVEKQYCQTRA
jgi:hypothetical protein